MTICLKRSIEITLLFALLISGIFIALKYEVDFPGFYNAGRLSFDQPLEIYGKRLASNGNRFFYGPISLIGYQGYALFDFQTAKILWIITQGIAFLVFWIFMYKTFPELWDKLLIWGLFFAVSVNSLHNNFQSNNIQTMILAALILAEIFSTHKNSKLQMLSGILVALVSAIKLFPLFICMYYFLFKSKSVRIGLVLGFLISLTLPIVWFGWDTGLQLHQQFFESVTQYHARGDNSLTDRYNIQCLPALLSRILPNHFVEGPFFGILLLGLSVSLTLGFLWICYQQKSKNNSNQLSDYYLWSLALALMTFLNSSSYGHYMVFYLPAIAGVIQLLTPFRKKYWFANSIFLIASVTLITVVDGIIGKHLSNILQYQNVPLYAVGLMMGVLVFCIYKVLPYQHEGYLTNK